MKERNTSMQQPQGERVIQRVCIFHNSGMHLYAFPSTWQAMFDFLRFPEQYLIQNKEWEVVRIETVPWGERLTSFTKGSVLFLYSGHAEAKPSKTSVTLEGEGWRIHDYRINPTISVTFALINGKGKLLRF
jgi:hypothetical protein